MVKLEHRKGAKKGAWHVGTGLGGAGGGGSQGGKEPALQQEYQPSSLGSLLPFLTEGERGRRENLGTLLQKYKIAGSTQFEKLD